MTPRKSEDMREDMRSEVAQSSLLAGYGALQPRTLPEDFSLTRGLMESLVGQSVAQSHTDESEQE